MWVLTLNAAAAVMCALTWHAGTHIRADFAFCIGQLHYLCLAGFSSLLFAGYALFGMYADSAGPRPFAFFPLALREAFPVIYYLRTNDSDTTKP